jgi:small subunit ribosomal protein S16
MATRIRLSRHGRKKQPIYYVVVADQRSPRDGRFIEKLGTFNPNVHPPLVDIDVDRAFYWVMTGAQPTDSVRTILSKEGVLLRKHLQVGVNKGAITQEEADKKYDAWRQERISKLEKMAADKAQAKADEQSRIEAEILKLREAEKKAEEEAKANAIAEAKAAEEAEKAAAEAEATEESQEDAEAAPEAKEETTQETKEETTPEAKEEPAPEAKE